MRNAEKRTKGMIPLNLQFLARWVGIIILLSLVNVPPLLKPVAQGSDSPSVGHGPFVPIPNTPHYPRPGQRVLSVATSTSQWMRSSPRQLTVLTLTEQAAARFSSFDAAGLQTPITATHTISLITPNMLALTLAYATLTPPALVSTQDIVDGWTQLFAASGEATFPPSGCVTFGAPNEPAQENGWRVVKYNTWSGFTAIAANRSTNAQAATQWWICGPFDLRQANKLMVEYATRLDAPTASRNTLFFGISQDGRRFQGMELSPHNPEWQIQQVLVEGITPQPRTWIAWAFHTFDDEHAAASAYVDGVKVWRYTPPSASCRQSDAGAKGVVLAPYDPTAAIPAPIIRAGDAGIVDNLQKLGVAWVRLGFQAQNGLINLLEYDRMIDTLCARGIRVLGLLNHEMLARQDYHNSDSTQMKEYQQEFAATAGWLAHYFAGRVGAWEVWNEPNLAEGAYLAPTAYATLLQQSYQQIKAADSQAPVIFGGLASSWRDSVDYLQDVYQVWDEQLQGVRPFDHLALHPYPRKREGPNPEIYFYAEQPEGYPTILDKFLQTMAEHGDGNKTIWVTEIGFNSARHSPHPPTCLGRVLVEEEEQAAYLKQSFDLLLTQVKLWGKQDQPAVEKIFWYQYMDVGATNPCFSAQGTGQGAQTDWWFGLYRGDKVTPKPVTCAFAAYPRMCGEALPTLYLPFVSK